MRTLQMQMVAIRKTIRGQSFPTEITISNHDRHPDYEMGVGISGPITVVTVVYRAGLHTFR